MTPIHTFRIGSKVFFDGIEGFQSKDIDELCIVDTFPFKNTNHIHCNGLHGKDVFFFRNMNKEQFKEDVKNSDFPMTAGKFLVPAFVEYLGFTIDDLKEFEDMFNSMDEKHLYEKLIYDFYIENNGFYLTDAQRMEAYRKYKEVDRNY